jgi:ubiquinol-cytochrome c reductase cytochrome b subunit
VGVGVLAFYVVLLLAGGQDIFAQQLSVSVTSVVWAFRILVLVLPVVAGWLAWKISHDLRRSDEQAAHKEAVLVG